MIKKLQRKFVLTVMLSLLAVMLIILGAINFANYYKMNSSGDKMLALLAENNGAFPDFFKNPANQNKADPLPGRTDDDSVPDKPDDSTQSVPDKKDFPADPGANASNRKDNGEKSVAINAETPFKTRFFTATADSDSNITETKTDSIAAVDSEEAASLAQQALAKGKTAGYIGIYKFLVSDSDSGKLIIFLDCRDDIQSALSLMWISLAVAFSALAVMFILVSVFSRKATRPVAESIEKQRQFITDAGHEIKTPLAIISANADVLGLTVGTDNEWLSSIKNQTKRLNSLVRELITLSKTDEDGIEKELVIFDLSDAAEDTVAPFGVLAQKKSIDFSVNIEPEITFSGNEPDIRKLISILTDNAIKYCSDGGSVDVELFRKGKNIVFEITNTCESIEKDQLPRLFDRFYRTDSSRSRETGGYGIGLSIAKAIVNRHKGKISAACDEQGTIRFSVIL